MLVGFGDSCCSDRLSCVVSYSLVSWDSPPWTTAQCHDFDTGEECRIDGKEGDDCPQKRREVRWGEGVCWGCVFIVFSWTTVVIVMNHNFWRHEGGEMTAQRWHCALRRTFRGYHILRERRSRNIIKPFYDIPWSFSPLLHKRAFATVRIICWFGKIIKNFMMTTQKFWDFLWFWKLLIMTKKVHDHDHYEIIMSMNSLWTVGLSNH